MLSLGITGCNLSDAHNLIQRPRHSMRFSTKARQGMKWSRQGQKLSKNCLEVLEANAIKLHGNITVLKSMYLSHHDKAILFWLQLNMCTFLFTIRNFLLNLESAAHTVSYSMKETFSQFRTTEAVLLHMHKSCHISTFGWKSDVRFDSTYPTSY